jgi:hypothetical protein
MRPRRFRLEFMPTVVWLLALAASIREDNTALRAACGPEERVVARLTAGTPVEIRFAMTAGMACYKVVAQVEGRPQLGYVAVTEVAGKEEFERNRLSGDSSHNNSATVTVLRPEIRLKPAAGDGVLHQAWDLIEANQPRQALHLLEPALPRFRGHAQALAVAGWAAYRADNPKLALEYWEQSLALKPDAHVEVLRERARREVSHDRSGDSLQGLRVTLRYEGTAVPAERAREMTQALDEEFSRIASQLGCRAEERVVAIVQTPAAYRASSAAAEWSGGYYDGRIHVPLLEGAQLGPNTRRTFAHELVHACLANLGKYPAWLHEGLAQRLSGEALAPAMRALVKEAITQKALPRLEELGQNWSGLSAEHARMAYALSWLAAEKLEQEKGAVGLRTILANPAVLESVTRELNQALGL